MVTVDEEMVERKLACWHVIESRDLAQPVEQNAKLFP